MELNNSTYSKIIKNINQFKMFRGQALVWLFRLGDNL